MVGAERRFQEPGCLFSQLDLFGGVAGGPVGIDQGPPWGQTGAALGSDRGRLGVGPPWGRLGAALGAALGSDRVSS